MAIGRMRAGHHGHPCTRKPRPAEPSLARTLCDLPFRIPHTPHRGKATDAQRRGPARTAGHGAVHTGRPGYVRLPTARPRAHRKSGTRRCRKRLRPPIGTFRIGRGYGHDGSACRDQWVDGTGNGRAPAFRGQVPGKAHQPIGFPGGIGLTTQTRRTDKWIL